jgi:hypothetical protein
VFKVYSNFRQREQSTNWLQEIENNFFTKIEPGGIKLAPYDFLGCFSFSPYQTAGPLCKAFIVSPIGTDSHSPHRVSVKVAQQAGPVGLEARSIFNTLPSPSWFSTPLLSSPAA